MELTSRKIIEINQLLQRYSRQRRGPQFVHMIARNILKLKPVITSLSEQQDKKSDEFKKYDEKRTELCKEMSDKSAAGDSLMNYSPEGVPVSYKIIERKEEFDEAVGKLKAEYEEAIEEEQKRKEEFEAFLDSEDSIEKVELKTIPFSAIPMKSDAKNPNDSEFVVTPMDLALFMEYEIVLDDVEDNVVDGKFPQPASEPSKKKKSRKRSKPKRRA